MAQFSHDKNNIVLDVFIQGTNKSLAFMLKYLKKKKKTFYDELNWTRDLYLWDNKYMSFPTLWRKWMEEYIGTATTSILVNGSSIDEFPLERGLRQDAHLSSFFFLFFYWQRKVCMLWWKPWWNLIFLLDIGLGCTLLQLFLSFNLLMIHCYWVLKVGLMLGYAHCSY